MVFADIVLKITSGKGAIFFVCAHFIHVRTAHKQQISIAFSSATFVKTAFKLCFEYIQLSLNRNYKQRCSNIQNFEHELYSPCYSNQTLFKNSLFEIDEYSFQFAYKGQHLLVPIGRKPDATGNCL